MPSSNTQTALKFDFIVNNTAYSLSIRAGRSGSSFQFTGTESGTTLPTAMEIFFAMLFRINPLGCRDADKAPNQKL
jgi:hypothetical protein